MIFTEEQTAAANHSTGHARIVAVAGAGKTATLVQAIKLRLESGADPRRILVLMYNRAAKDDFDRKLYQSGLTSTPTVRTFHSLGLKIYRRLIDHGFLAQASLAPLPNTMIDLQIKQLLQENYQASIKMQNNETLQEWVETTSSFIQLVKCHLNGPKQTFEDLSLPEDNKFLIEVFQQFESWRKGQRSITYDDMLYDPANALQQFPESQSLISEILDDILVDEYQDINPIQHFLLKTIAGARANVIVIGDPDQTIYEFRGSAPSFINHTFANDFNKPLTFSLSKTFRFGHELALAANHLITNNHNRLPILTISADNTPNTRIHLAAVEDHGHKIASTIFTLKQNGASYQGMAVLCRLWSFARPIELQLMAQGIPYRIEGEQSILQCGEIKPFMHLLSILSEDFFSLSLQKKSQHLFEILATPSPKIPHKVLHEIAKKWAEIIQQTNVYSSLKKALPKGLSPFQYKALNTLVTALKQLDSTKPATVKLQKYAAVLEFQKKLKESALNPTRGDEQSGTIDAFLTFLKTLKNQSAAQLQEHFSTMHNNSYSQSIESVTLTTIHRSKGREWPAVFIPDVTEGHLPYIASNNSNVDIDTLESERRLMYVAMTRAQKKLFLTTSLLSVEKHKNSNRKGQAEQSRFLKEMELESCQHVANAIYNKCPSVNCDKNTQDVTRKYFQSLKLPIDITYVNAKNSEQASNQATSWVKGSRVQHNILGLGEVVAVDGNKIKICFDSGGIRTFVRNLVEPHLCIL